MNSKTHKFSIITLVSAIILVVFYLLLKVTYEGLIDIFAFNTFREHFIIGALLSFFTGSFILASILGMRYYNWFTRWYYYISAIWMGFLTYLFFISAIYEILAIFLIPFLHLTAMILIVVSFISIIYGILHAKKITLKNIEIKLPNLSAAWLDRKAIWISDLHLGQINGPSFTEKVANMVQALRPDIIFIGGDLFDGTKAIDLKKSIAPLKKLTPPLGVYFISGNHEEFGNSEMFFKAVRDIGIRTLVDEIADVDGLQIIGVDYKNSRKREKFREILSNLSIDRSKPSILLKHEPKDLDVASGAGVTFQISGHTHQGQMMPFGYIASLIYKGYSYGFKKFRNMQVLVSSGTGTWGPPIRIGTDSEIVILKFSQK